MPKREKSFITSARAFLMQAEREYQLQQHAKAANAYWSGIESLLSVAVCNHESADAGITYLSNEDIPHYIARCAEETRATMDQIRSGDEYDSVIGGNYHLLVLVHLAWLLNLDDAADCFIGVANEQQIRRYGGKFWNDYALGVSFLVDHQQYRPAELKLKAREKHWDTYRELMRAVTHGDDLTQSLEQIEMMFEKRNRDKRIAIDHSRIEGDGHFPVFWDFRRWSFLSFIKRHYPHYESIT